MTFSSVYSDDDYTLYRYRCLHHRMNHSKISHASSLDPSHVPFLFHVPFLSHVPSHAHDLYPFDDHGRNTYHDLYGYPYPYDGNTKKKKN